MPELTDSQERTRVRVEGVIALISPALDALLAVGDRVSRIVEPEDYGYYPARPLADAEEDAAPPSPPSG